MSGAPRIESAAAAGVEAGAGAEAGAVEAGAGAGAVEAGAGVAGAVEAGAPRKCHIDENTSSTPLPPDPNQAQRQDDAGGNQEAQGA